MSTINQLAFNDTPQLSDQIPHWSQSAGVTERTSINQILQVLNQLPTVQPVTGSGQLWLNNGVVTVA
ncbi:hypothetical protein WM40_23850 [Robbsia andropogonis]|uniref:Uncharacterized protein n=1 Tax=Robbsia andropogonis TaxID=28092 RepID=A0A0F5JUL2_9BURK|nr:hypothetical protein [Robbsia andropogonis]KKB61334.1 hypothetical protein WM40_23850 [Robbsia andropogonis]